MYNTYRGYDMHMGMIWYGCDLIGGHGVFCILYFCHYCCFGEPSSNSSSVEKSGGVDEDKTDLLQK